MTTLTQIILDVILCPNKLMPRTRSVRLQLGTAHKRSRRLGRSQTQSKHWFTTSFLPGGRSVPESDARSVGRSHTPSQTPSTGLRHPSFLEEGQCRKAMLGVWAGHTLRRAKLQALVYDIRPPSTTTAVFSYAIGSKKLSANELFFVDAQTAVSLLQTTQIKQGVSFIAAIKVYTSAKKSKKNQQKSVSFSTPAKQGSSVLIFAWLCSSTFLQFYAGMLKDIVHLLGIYSCIGSELLRAKFPFTLLDF